MTKEERELRAQNLCKELSIDPFMINPKHNEPIWRSLLRLLEWERDKSLWDLSLSISGHS